MAGLCEGGNEPPGSLKDKVYVVFMDLEKSFDRVDWNKLMRILKKIVVDWKEGRLYSNLYMKQRISQDRKRNVRRSEIGKEVRQGCPLSPNLFKIYLEDLVKNCFQNMGGVIVGGRR
ncbi:hypothetical protein ANN_15495 [Periplaneta americana]|uniref:Reverse transcriptase domain-containing protein n=1 Tax=Periplaneta americana TaxID=6978 RepID=A0ABQ8SHR2_PERAM|nr:hypothetical protein ANN_15495 [Periplaneta americana]